MQNDASSVRILRPSAKVSPEPIVPTLDSEPELVTRCVFGVALEKLREDGQMVRGIPNVLRDMVEFLDKNGKLATSLRLLLCFPFIRFYPIDSSFLLSYSFLSFWICSTSSDVVAYWYGMLKDMLLGVCHFLNKWWLIISNYFIIILSVNYFCMSKFLFIVYWLVSFSALCVCFLSF